MVTIKPQRTQAIFRAISDPTRREILNLLRARPLAVGEIASNFHTSRPAVSKHLRLLRSAGLITVHERGTANICELNARPLRAVNEWLGDYRTYWDETLRGLKKYLEAKP